MEDFLLQLFIFLTAAVIAVPIARKLGLGSVLGYLIAGIVIGPFSFSLIKNVDDVMHFTEFGVVMMLFLVGLELKPSLLWKMRTPVLGMGGLQVVASSFVIGSIACFFIPWQQALAVGLILSLSSTAIVLQTLQEKGLTNTSGGRSVFSVLLFQDLAVIPMLALLPLLATVTLHHDGDGHKSSLIDISVLPGYQQVIATVLAVVTILMLGRFASRPIFRTIAKTHIREIFVATALALILGISLLMTVVGLSPALGVFLAGVVLADSEYRHELESDLEPFKGLLLGIFFISIGASLNFTLIGNRFFLIAGLTTALITAKWLILLGTAWIFHIEKKDRLFFSVSLAQGGEFAFVLFQFSKQNGILSNETIDPLISAVAISMFLAPLLFLIYDKLSVAKQNIVTTDHKSDEIDRNGHKVILAGFGRLGTDVGRFLISAGIRPVIIDHNAANVDLLRKFGFEVYYGDITRPDLLEAAGAASAELLVIAIGDVEKSEKLTQLCMKHYPHLEIVASAADRTSAYKLMDLGLSHVCRETFGSALKLGQKALQVLGFHPYESHQLMRIFQKNDQAMLPNLHKIYREDEESYITMYRKYDADLEELLKLDLQSDTSEFDRAWTTNNPEK